MELQSIENTVRQLVRLHQSNDPFKLAGACGIIVVRENLGTIRGYFGKSFGSRVIHVNESLNEVDARFTCAHELGHAILHPKTNTPFLRGNTMFSVNKLERQANLQRKVVALLAIVLRLAGKDSSHNCRTSK